MTRDQVKAAADALGRLEALEKARDSAQSVPHEALPISFFDAGAALPSGHGFASDHGIKAYYPREKYERIIRALIREEQRTLNALGVLGDWSGPIAPGLYTE